MMTNYSALMAPWHGAEIDENHPAVLNSDNAELLQASRGLVDAAYQQMLRAKSRRLPPYPIEKITSTTKRSKKTWSCA